MASTLLAPLRALALSPAARRSPIPSVASSSSKLAARAFSSHGSCCRAPALAGRIQTASVTAAAARPSIAARGAAPAGTLLPLRAQQTRGMKVHSSIKRRCEHCKV